MHETCTRFFQIELRDLVYLKFILEAYEGLSVLSTVDQKAGIVKLSYPSCFTNDIAELVGALSADITIMEVPPPDSEPERPCHA
jgi:hypothetical protein